MVGNCELRNLAIAYLSYDRETFTKTDHSVEERPFKGRVSVSKD